MAHAPMLTLRRNPPSLEDPQDFLEIEVLTLSDMAFQKVQPPRPTSLWIVWDSHFDHIL